MYWSPKSEAEEQGAGEVGRCKMKGNRGTEWVEGRRGEERVVKERVGEGRRKETLLTVEAPPGVCQNTSFCFIDFQQLFYEKFIINLAS